MTMKFVFVRHGDYEREGDHSRSVAPLTELGAEQALHFAEWLQEKNVKPDLVISTNTKRTLETYQWLKLVLGHTDFKIVGSGFTLGKQSLDQKLQIWNDQQASTIVFVGHCKQQEYCLHKLGGPKLKNDQRAALIYEKMVKGWSFVDGTVV